MNDAALTAEPDRGSDGGRPARVAVMAFATDAATEAVLRDSLASDAIDAVEVRRGGLEDAARFLERNASPHVLLVDITGNAEPLTTLAELSQLVEPDVRVLAIGDRQDLTLYRGLTHGLGVLEYLFKPLTREMVAEHFGPILARQRPGPRGVRGGRVITVTGVHGGIGATAVAANLAWYLAERARRHTLLLDGDLYGAAAAMLLSVKPKSGLRVALEHPERVDDLFLDRTAQLVGERLFVLSGEGTLADPLPMAQDALPRLLDVLRRRYKFLVCDAPFPASPIGRAMFDAANQRVLVTEPSVAGARDVLRYLAMPQATGIVNIPLVVLNFTGVPGSLSLAQFATTIGREPDVVIPYMKGALREAANLGEPAAAKHTAFGRAMQALALRAASVGEAAMPRRWPWGRR
jgi:pilus assembly protein CpaE